jgi:uncharacterized membrane protein
MRFRPIFTFLAIFALLTIPSSPALAIDEPTEPQSDTYATARVVEIIEESTHDVDGASQKRQLLKLVIQSGAEKGKTITIDHGGSFIIGQFRTFSVDDTVIVAKPAPTEGSRPDFYYITDIYRTPKLAILVLFFFALAIIFGRSRGFTSILGLIFTILVIFYGIIPRILAGADPFITCLLGAIVISFVSLYLSHGFSRRTTLALTATLVCLAVAVGLDIVFVWLAGLTGGGTEEAFYLQLDSASLNLRGLLLGSIIIGVLGVLDDITTSQTAAIEEIYMANNRLSFHELWKSGLSVGREHIASLVNTLVLAYVGVSFPLLLLFNLNKTQSLSLLLNSNFIAEEIVRTLVGSSTLIIAVPVTTFIAAYYLTIHQTKK